MSSAEFFTQYAEALNIGLCSLKIELDNSKLYNPSWWGTSLKDDKSSTVSVIVLTSKLINFEIKS